MDILERYKSLWNYHLDFEIHKPYIPEPEVIRKYVPPTVKPITLTSQDMRSKGHITAHDLRDYRRTGFNLVLLPEVELPYDVIAREVYGL